MHHECNTLKTRLFAPLFLLLAFCLFVPSWSAAQVIVFPNNGPEFVPKLGEFMTASKRPDMEEAFTVFKTLYRNNQLPEADMQKVIAVATRMGELKLSAFPYFKNFVNAVSASKSNADTTLFDRWIDVTTKTIAGAQQGKTKPIGAYLEFSVDFLEHRALKTGEGGSVTWKIKGGSFDFDFVDSSKQGYIKCKDIDLVAFRKQDSIIIRKTSGVYFPFTNRWKGTGGKVDWRAVGLDSSVVATLYRYEVDANKASFKSDTASLNYPLYFPQGPILGSCEHFVVVSSKDSTVQYPRFESFAKTLTINKIGEGIEYTGGFRQWGNVMYGYGNGSEQARLTVFDKRRRKVFFGAANLYSIRRQERIVSEDVDAHMYMEDGSEISHPGAAFRLDVKKQSITLERGLKGSQRNPFYSTFYNMNLEAERLAYRFNADSLEIGAQVAGRKGVEQKVGFQSSKLYDPAVLIRLQNIAEKNPISVLYLLGLRNGKDSLDRFVINDGEFARELNAKWDRTIVQSLLAQLVAEGFINYYFERGQIILRDKLVHYALASADKTDYDAIDIQSTSKETNAVLDLKSKETTINEIKRVELSRRQHVAISPRDQKLVLLKNRDMRLTGRLFAGYALFEGENMAFNYDKFEIQFDSVKHLDFYLPYGEKDPITKLRPANSMNSTVEFVSGVLLIDAPNNKAGKQDLEMFPSLQSKKNSFVYYQKPSIQNNAYTRDSFFFKLDAFTLNQIDDYEAEQIRFKGEMRPALIFPPFRETIIVRSEDKSFGFIHKTPVAGYPTYAAKGNFSGEVDLSNKGFLGEGTVKYLTASIESEDLIFKPKQMTGTAQKFFMSEDRAGAVKVPEAKGQDVKVNWLPFRDSMYVESKAKDFNIYKTAGYSHKGVLILTPSGLKGTGILEWSAGKLTSKLISYGPFQAKIDTGNLQIKALTAGALALDTREVKGYLDFDKQEGQFKSNSGSNNTTLPLDQYITSMNEFDWNMKEQLITFKSDPKKPGRFVSIDPDQDSLRFTGKTAVYDMKTNLLSIGGVDVIKSADAFVYPDSGAVEILSGGAMKQLANARIVADTVSKYHVITRATVDIIGKKDYKAKGYYQYNIPGYDQEVFFDNIIGERVGPGSRSTKNLLTTASGPVKADANFRMDLKTFFKGDVKLEANKPNLTFEGYARLDADPRLNNTQWFTVNSLVDKNSPIIRIKNSKNEADDPNVTGMYLARETGEIYPRILQPAYSRRDRALINAQQVFKYEASSDRFIFGDSSKIIDNALRGSKMIFDNRVASVVAEGPIALGSGLLYMKVKAAGRLRTDFNTTDSTGFQIAGEIMSGMEVTLPPKVADAFINGIKAGTYDAPNAIYTAQSAFYQLALPEFIKDPKLDPTIAADIKNNLILIPKAEDKYTFLLGRHNIVWNAEYQSFLSKDDKMPLISINGEQINKVLTTYVEYKMPANEDDRFYIEFQATPELWYFFGYQSGVLNVCSSDTKFMDLLLAMKPKDLQFKMSDGELYEVVPSDLGTARRFVDRVKEGRK